MTKAKHDSEKHQSVLRRKAQKVMQQLLDEGLRKYICEYCGHLPKEDEKLDINHENKDITDYDPVNLKFACRKCHYAWDRATAKGVSKIENEYGY